MGIKIVNLPPTTTVNANDFLPVSQNIGGSRQTYKMSFAQLSGFMLSNTNKALRDLKTSSNNTYVHLSGDVMTGGYLTLYNNPVDPYHAATKDYIDVKVYDLKEEIQDPANGYVHITGDTMTGALQLNGDPTKPLEATPKSYVDTQISNLRTSTANGFVHLSGDTMTGPLDLSNSELRRFSAKVIEKGADFTLTNDMNGSVILVDSSSQILFTVAAGTLIKGFNAVILQMGDGNAKITTSGSVTIVNVNNGIKTRKKFAQMNLCVVRPNVVWIAGDII
jgi:hypothetical protein